MILFFNVARKTIIPWKTLLRNPVCQQGNHMNGSIVFEEYLIFDIIGMIGSVGGTLGMCIGFSFTNVITIFFKFVETSLK